MCGNTRPKLLEVSYWKASQLNKGLFTTSSPHFTEYCTNLKHARHGGFQTLDVEHWIDSRRPLNKHLTLRQRKTKTEADEDRDRRRQGQTKTEIDEDRDGRRRHPTVTKTELDTSPLMRPADYCAHERSSSLCSPRSSRGTAPVLSFLNLLSGKR